MTFSLLNCYKLKSHPNFLILHYKKSYFEVHDEESVQVLKTRMLSVDKNMLTVDTRRNQSKRFGGPGADARYRKSYR